ncbi:hypothetical protein DFA_08667 [Cavenderia fasciculata]|uniref:Uncharacterized protein n=1 Tax=Cavenderia fasciculata TaxID=261658 RepID=F4Q3L3_CACFS|nr:uncharacterized protein DFA_08667 [Cavenderia fasciculata]EGG17671.1 hypothetical protein DFA_08667 [Cavenderia fasciculata]|eukprot:XP_004356155.1 hypothetical protein DFA_08667 [Cavenderia fasciculata]
MTIISNENILILDNHFLYISLMFNLSITKLVICCECDEISDDWNVDLCTSDDDHRDKDKE